MTSHTLGRRFGTAMAAVAVLLLGSTALSTAAQAETWRFALEEIEGSVQDKYAQKFKELVEERSGGDVTVQVFPYGALGTSQDLTELAANGSLQFTFASPGHLATMVPAMGVFNLPYILSANNEVNKQVLTEGDVVYQQIAPKLEEKNLQLITMFPEGEMVWTTNKEIRTPQDMEGFKMRVMTSPILTEAYRSMGASPTPMPYGEVYGGLQLGQIDGQVNPVFAIEEMKFYEVQDYMIWAGQQQFTTSVVANGTFYEGLSEDRRDMLGQVTADLADYIFEVQAQYADERLEKIKEAKPDITMIELTAEERAAFRERAMAARDTFVDMTGEDGKATLEALKAEIAQTEQSLGQQAEGE